MREKTEEYILTTMISIGVTGSTYTFNLYMRDKAPAGATALYLKMVKGDDDTVRYYEIINTSTSLDYSTFLIDPSDLKSGDYNASILTAITGGQEIWSARARVAIEETKEPQVIFTQTNNKIVFNG